MATLCGSYIAHTTENRNDSVRVVEALHALNEIVFLVPSALLWENVYSTFLERPIRYC